MNLTVRSLCTLLVCALTTGCYAYAAAAPDSVPVGADVRARISATQAERVGEVLGRDNRVLQGVVMESGAETLLLAVPSVATTPGAPDQRLRQNLPIPRSEILELEIRRLDPWRTAGLVGAAAAVLGYIVVEAFDGNGGSPAGGRPGGDQSRIPVLSPPAW
jgi:hypothetical protein